MAETGKSVMLDYCNEIPAGTNCNAAGQHTVVEYLDQMIVKSKGFASPGDSGALVMTQGSCPQPIGIVIGGTASDTYISPISDVLAALQTAGNYTLNMVSTCSTSSGDQSQNDEVDKDVAAAQNAIAQEGSVWLSASGVVAVTVDMSVTPAAIDIECANQGYADLLPNQFQNSYNGIPIEYTVEEEVEAF